jgi:Tfp pilus assembly protein FimT
MTKTANHTRQAGYSTVELLVVMAMSLIIAAVAVPTYNKVTTYLRAVGDLRSINSVIAQAKMRAAADFTHARAYFDTTGGTYHLETWNKANSCWQTDGDTANNCTAANSPKVALSTGIAYGFGNIGAGPTPGSSVLTQAPLCINKVAGNPGGTGGTTASTACIEFNSRGIPVDATNAPVATGAIYVTDQNTVEGVTISATGSIQSWVANGACSGAACWHAQ